MKKRSLSILLALLLIVSVLPVTAAAAGPALLTEFVPTGKLSAPKAPYLTNEPWGGGDLLTIWYSNGPEALAMTKARNLWEATDEAYADDSQEKFLARFGVADYLLYVETDCRIDGGAWQHTADWDEPEADPCFLEGMPGNLVFGAHEGIDGGKVYADFSLSWLTYIDPENAEDTAGFLLPALYTDVDEYGETCYHFDLDNHTLGFRCRTKLLYWEEAGAEPKVLISDWSPETSIGKNGNQKTLAAPTTIPAPVIDTFELRVDTDSAGQRASAYYYLNIPESVYDGILYCTAQEGMFEPYHIESQLRVNGGDWTNAYTANEVWIFSDTRAADPETGELKATDTVEIRARLTCPDLGLTSDWSNVIGNKPDFTAHSWAQDQLGEADALGLIPDCLRSEDLTLPITRAEFAAVSVKLFEAMTYTQAEPAPADTFSDTQDPEILKAFALGVTNGTNTKTMTFEPEKLISREQAATMLTRVYKKIMISGWTLETDKSYDETFRAMFTMPALFEDDAEISGYAKDSVYFMAANGIVNGVSTTRYVFAPKLVVDGESTKNYATREQALLMSVRMVNNLG